MKLTTIFRHYSDPYYTKRDRASIIKRAIRENMSPPRNGQRPRYKDAGHKAARAIGIVKLLAATGARPAAVLDELAAIYEELRANNGGHAFSILMDKIGQVLPSCGECGHYHRGARAEDTTAAPAHYCPRCVRQAQQCAANDRLNGRTLEQFEGLDGTRHGLSGRFFTVQIALVLPPGAPRPNPERHSDGIWRCHRDRARLRNYSDRTGALPGATPDGLNFGVELEVAFATKQQEKDFCRELHGAFDPEHCIAKSDSSILGSITLLDQARAGHGFGGQAEIVTGYGPLAEVRATLARAMAIAKKHGAKCPSSCGLHISASRAPMTETQIAKIICFWSNPENERDLLKFQRRAPNHYCQLSDREFANVKQQPDRIVKITDWIYALNAGRYAIVSTSHDTHIEFRGFGGSMTPRLNWARLGLVSELVEYCEQATTLDELTIAPFIRWMKGRGTAAARIALSRFNVKKPGSERLRDRAAIGPNPRGRVTRNIDPDYGQGGG